MGPEREYPPSMVPLGGRLPLITPVTRKRLASRVGIASTTSGAVTNSCALDGWPAPRQIGHATASALAHNSAATNTLPVKSRIRRCRYLSAEFLRQSVSTGREPPPTERSSGIWHYLRRVCSTAPTTTSPPRSSATRDHALPPLSPYRPPRSPSCRASGAAPVRAGPGTSAAVPR